MLQGILSILPFRRGAIYVPFLLMLNHLNFFNHIVISLNAIFFDLLYNHGVPRTNLIVSREMEFPFFNRRLEIGFKEIIEMEVRRWRYYRQGVVCQS